MGEIIENKENKNNNNNSNNDKNNYLYYELPSYIKEKYGQYGLKNDIKMRTPKIIKLPYYALYIGYTKKEKDKENFIYHSNLNYDIEHEITHDNTSIFYQIISDTFLLSHRDMLYCIYKEDSEGIETCYYHIVCHQKNSLYHINKLSNGKTIKAIEYVFIIDEKYILPVYIDFDSYHLDASNNITKWITDVLEEDFPYLEFNFWDWLLRYCPNIEETKENNKKYKYSIDVCTEFGEWSTLYFSGKNREIGRFSLVSVRMF